MRLPTVQGIIRRRILANFRVDPAVMQQQLPSRFRPKLHDGHAIAGICLIRLEHIRPLMTPEMIGMSSENAAHRVAVLWEDNGVTREGVYISRRDTDSRLTFLLGGRLFPGEQHQAAFTVADENDEIKLSVLSKDQEVAVEIEGTANGVWPATSIFSSLADASSFFEGGALGYSVTSEAGRLDGLHLETKEWKVEPLDVRHIHSSYFSDRSRFPDGSITFDNALLMRDLEHEWHTAEHLYV